MKLLGSPHHKIHKIHKIAHQAPETHNQIYPRLNRRPSAPLFPFPYFILFSILHFNSNLSLNTLSILTALFFYIHLAQAEGLLRGVERLRPSRSGGVCIVQLPLAFQQPNNTRTKIVRYTSGIAVEYILRTENLVPLTFLRRRSYPHCCSPCHMRQQGLGGLGSSVISSFERRSVLVSLGLYNNVRQSADEPRSMYSIQPSHHQSLNMRFIRRRLT